MSQIFFMDQPLTTSSYQTGMLCPLVQSAYTTYKTTYIETVLAVWLFHFLKEVSIAF